MSSAIDPLGIKNALSPSSPSEMMVSPALNAMACMNLSASLDRCLAPPPGDDGGQVYKVNTQHARPASSRRPGPGQDFRDALSRLAYPPHLWPARPCLGRSAGGL